DRHAYADVRLPRAFYLYVTPPAAPQLYTLSLHDALPISSRSPRHPRRVSRNCSNWRATTEPGGNPMPSSSRSACNRDELGIGLRSEEHTSELQSRFDLVCRLLLEKKKKTKSHRMIPLRIT